MRFPIVRSLLGALRPSPVSPAEKRAALRSLAERYGLKILVETGTYRGDMVEAMKQDFDRVYSIELSSVLFQAARRRFQNDGNVEILHGDSADLLHGVLSMLDQPALFWLDAHYSGGETARGARDTPVLVEIESILRSSDSAHVILVDDARLFGRDPAYPSIDEVIRLVRRYRTDAVVEVVNDGIRIPPQ